MDDTVFIMVVSGIIGEKLSSAMIINLPERMKALSAKRKRRHEMHAKIKEKREEKAAKSAAKKLLEMEKQAAKTAHIAKLGTIVGIVTGAGYCKPSMNQIKLYLKKEKGVSKETLDAITDENLVEVFHQLNEVG